MKIKLIKKMQNQAFSFNKKDISCLEYDFVATSFDGKINIYFYNKINKCKIAKIIDSTDEERDCYVNYPFGNKKVSYEKVYNYLFNPKNKDTK